MDIQTAAWIVVIVSVVGFVLYRLSNLLSQDLMMRCPETQSISVIRVAPAVGDDATAPKVTVRQCTLWPERKNCTQGCLARYPETTPGLRINLNALRPFKPQ